MRFPQLVHELRDYQTNAVNRILNGCNSRGQYVEFIAGPTGSGKSIVELKAHFELEKQSFVVTPRIEIIAGMLDKCNVTYDSVNELIDKALDLQITTPIRLRNAMLAGKIDPPRTLILDEGHHAEADTYQQLKLLCGNANYIALSASPYRGTPKSTASLYAEWGKPHWMITYREALDKGYISMPTVETWPVVDDDLIEIGSNGEFVISRLTSAYKDKLEFIFRKLISDGFTIEYGGSNFMIEPTMISVASSNIMPYLEKMANACGFNVCCITDETPFKQRQLAFQFCLAKTHILCHINTVSEGVDLPIRINIDLSPTMSPNVLVQRFGRGTRPIPDGEPCFPYYICTNRNIERHGYLFDGVLPVSYIASAQTAFENPSNRIGMRAFGLESLGRMKGFRVQLTDNLRVTCYAVTQMNGTTKSEYFVICHPKYANPLWFNKKSTKTSVTEEKTFYDYGKWEACTPPDNMQGFKSHQQNGLTPKQKDYWTRHSTTYGLVTDQDVNAKTFQILPVLKDSHASLVEKDK